jgi:hypothetical protein
MPPRTRAALPTSAFGQPDLRVVGASCTQVHVKRIPARPDLGHLRKQAKELLASGSDGVLVDGRLKWFSDEVTDYLLGASRAP